MDRMGVSHPTRRLSYGSMHERTEAIVYRMVRSVEDSVGREGGGDRSCTVRSFMKSFELRFLDDVYSPTTKLTCSYS